MKIQLTWRRSLVVPITLQYQTHRRDCLFYFIMKKPSERQEVKASVRYCFTLRETSFVVFQLCDMRSVMDAIVHEWRPTSPKSRLLIQSRQKSIPHPGQNHVSKNSSEEQTSALIDQIRGWSLL